MTLGLLAKLLVSKQLKFEKGLITLKDFSMTLIPSFFVGELTRYFYEDDKLFKLYLLSWYWGYVLTKELKEKFNLKTPDQVYSLGMNFGAAMGMGLYKTHDYYPGRYTHFAIHNNPYLKYLNFKVKPKKPVDYFISGAMGGGACFVHDTLCQNVETKCIAVGDSNCDFLTGTEKELKKRGLWQEAVKRYNLSKILPLQREIYNNYSKENESELIAKIGDKLNDL